MTNTLPLHVEVSYNEYDSVAAFASASILAGLAIVTLLLKSFLEWQMNAQRITPPLIIKLRSTATDLIYKLSLQM